MFISAPPSCTSMRMVAQQVYHEGNDFIAIIEFDMLEYKKRTGSQAVKKTLTIPSWLNYEAEKAGINFSSTLQNAIKDQLGLR